MKEEDVFMKNLVNLSPSRNESLFFSAFCKCSRFLSYWLTLYRRSESGRRRHTSTVHTTRTTRTHNPFAGWRAPLLLSSSISRLAFAPKDLSARARANTGSAAAAATTKPSSSAVAVDVALLLSPLSISSLARFLEKTFKARREERTGV